MDLQKFSGVNFFKALLDVATKHHLSINGLATKLGYPASTLSRWRDGIVDPRINTIMDIIERAKKLGMDIKL